MENQYKHFSHPHFLSFHQSLVHDAQLTCTGCNFPCTGTPVYACHPCQFFLHDQCFDATRSLIHPSHTDHPITLSPYPTYPSSSLICNSCNKTGSGFCYTCSTCDFDLHVHCAYNDLDLKRATDPQPKQIQLKAHPNHPLNYLLKTPYDSDTVITCDVCGTECDPNGALYHCDVCGFDVHVDCTNLPQTEQREDHEHELSLLHVNPNEEFECDICKGAISQTNCMYSCESGCNYGMHVKCVAADIVKKSPMDEALAFQLQMLNFQNKMRMQQMTLSAIGGIIRRT